MPYSVAPAQTNLRSLNVRFILPILVAGLLLSASAPAQVSFDGVQNTLASFPISDSLSPIAVDANGDVFFVDSNGTTTTLYEVPANGSLTALNSSFPFVPGAIAVNSAGNTLYFIYYGSTTNCAGGYVFVAIALVSTGTPANMPCSFPFSGYGSTYTVMYSDPTGLAVDPSGNLWIADYGGGEFFEIPAPVGSASVPTKIAALTLGQPYDIAVNGNGEVYFTILTFPDGNEVQEVADVPSTSFTNSISSPAVAASPILTNVPSIQSGLALDSSADIYLGGGGAPDSEVTGNGLIPLYGDFVDGTDGLATDLNGDLFIDGVDVTGTNYVVELNKKAANFGSQQVGQTSAAQTLDFTITDTTVGSIGFLTQGSANMDFGGAAGTTCTAQAYTASTACVVNITFTPKAPGLRVGAVVFYSGANNTGTVLAMVPLHGVGLGAQIAYGPGTATAIDPTADGLELKYPAGVAIDMAGDQFIADSNNNRVVEVPVGGGAAVVIDPTVNTLGLSYPLGVAVDGAGDLFIADYGNARVVEMPAGGGTPIAIEPTVDGTGFDGPYAVAVDGAGDLFVADEYNDRVVEVPFGGGTPIAIAPTVNSEALAYPLGVAVDGAGDLFISDYEHGRVVEVPVGGGAPTAISPTANGEALDGPAGVAVDAAGDLFIADYFNARVVEVPAGGGTPIAIDPTVNGSGFYGPTGIAVDQTGNLFIGDFAAWRLVEIQHSLPPTLSFPTATTAFTTDTADGPQTVQIANIGNQALTFTAPESGTNPSYPASFPENSADINLCGPGSSFQPGFGCDVSADFIPQVAGTITGSVVLTDNALDQTGGIQNIPLNGTGKPVPAELTAPAPNSVLGTSATFTWGPGAGVSHYWLTVGTAATGANSKNIYPGAPTTSVSAVVSGIPAYGQPIYVTLSSEINGTWQSTIYDFTESGSPVAAALTSPTPGSQFASSSVTFTWSAGGGVTNYWIELGTAASGANAKNIYSSGSVTVLTETVTGLPTNGEAIYATLYSYIGGAWQPTVYSFYATGPSVLITPTLSTKLNASATFAWTSGTGIAHYWLNLGTSASGANAKNLYSTGSTTALTATATGIPQFGENIYATLYSYISGVWQPIVYTYTASGSPVAAVLTTPTPSSKLTSSSVTFTWSAGEGVTNYWLNLGTASSGANSKNLYSGSSTTLTSVNVTGLPTNGETIYATLYSYIAGAWQPTVYTYTASGSPTPASLTAPSTSSPLSGSTATFTWSPGSGVTYFWFNLGTALSGANTKNLYSGSSTTATSITVSGLPTNGEKIYATLYSYIGGAWQPIVYTYTTE